MSRRWRSCLTLQADHRRLCRFPVACEADVLRDVDACKVKRRGVWPVTDRQRVVDRIEDLRERTRAVLDVLEVNLIRAGKLAVSGRSENQVSETGGTIEDYRPG